MKLSEIKTNGNVREDEKPDPGLVESIKVHGVIEPLVVNRDNVLIAGHRRLAAAKVLGLKEVPTVKLNVGSEEVQALQFAENVHRKDLTPLEKANVIWHYVGERPKEELPGLSTKEFKEKLAGAAHLLGVTAKSAWTLYRLAGLPKPFLKWLEDGVVGVEHAHVILGLTPEQQENVVSGMKWKVPEKGGGQAMVSDFERFVDRTYGKDLKEAVFPKTEPYADKQACSGCPYNSANLDALFQGHGLGTCRLASCFKSKTDRFWSTIRESFAKKEPWSKLKFQGYAAEAHRWNDANVLPVEVKGLVVEAKQPKEPAGWALVKSGKGIPVFLVEPAKSKKKPEERQRYDPKAQYVGFWLNDKLQQEAVELAAKLPDAKVLAFWLTQAKEDLKKYKLPLTGAGLLRLDLMNRRFDSELMAYVGLDVAKRSKELAPEAEKAWADKQAKENQPGEKKEEEDADDGE